MVFEKKEDQDMHIKLMIKNNIADELAFNLSKRSEFHSHHEFVGFLQEELDEVVEALNDFNEEMEKIWNMIKKDEVNEKIIERMRVAGHLAEELIHESIHVAAVVNKGVTQLEKAPTTDQSR